MTRRNIQLSIIKKYASEFERRLKIAKIRFKIIIDNWYMVRVYEFQSHKSFTRAVRIRKNTIISIQKKKAHARKKNS